MKKIKAFSSIAIILALNSCNANYGTNYPVLRPASNASANEVEREYNELLKSYKPETAEVLNDILSDSSTNPKTSITVENKSSCNMVLTISGNNYIRKIPIGAGKIGYAMVPKNQNYKLSSMVCRSVYQSTKFISSSYSITLSN
jgi:hypothetical protein